MNRGYPPPITSSRWGARTKRIVSIVILLVMGFLIINLVDLIPLLVIAALLSYLLWPLVNLIETHVLFVLPFRARSLAVVMTFVGVFALIIFAGVLIVPVLINQLADVGENIPRFVDALEVEIEYLLNRPLNIGGNPIILGGEPVILGERILAITGENGGLQLASEEGFNIFGVIGSFIGPLGGLTGSAFSVLGGAVDAIINTTFLIVIMFYFMRDGMYFATQMISLVPESYQGDVRRLLYELGLVWNAYFRGQIILSTSVGLAVYIAALVLGLPNAPVFGMLSGLLEFIPNFGPFIALVPAATIALFSESSTLPFLSGVPYALVVIVVWTVIQNLEAFYLVPRVMGGSLNLHPVVVILAVIAGASIAGALGVILAAPFTATLRLIGQYFYGKLFDTNPFPTPRPYEITENSGFLVRIYLAVRQFNIRRVLRRGDVGPVSFTNRKS